MTDRSIARAEPQGTPAALSRRFLMYGVFGLGGAMAGAAVTAGGWLHNPAPASRGTVAVPAVADTPGLVRTGDSVQVPEGSPYRAQLTVAAVQQRSLTETRQLPAAIEADPARVANVLPPLGGRVIALKVNLGDKVKQGDPLVVIDSGDLAQAYADADKAHAQLALTRRALERARGLTQAGGGAVKDLESAANDFEQAQAEANRADSRLKTISGGAAISGNRVLTVPAPASGTVTALSVAPGSYINDATQSMLTVTNLDQVWVTANVPEKDIGFVAPGQKVEVNFIAYPGETFHSAVLFINALMEPDTRRTKVRMALDGQNGRLKPNMFATVTFHAPPRSVLVVPNAALLMNNDSTTVYLETAPWTFVRRPVETGYDADGQTIVTRGLAAGERIVTRGGVLLND